MIFTYFFDGRKIILTCHDSKKKIHHCPPFMWSNIQPKIGKLNKPILRYKGFLERVREPIDSLSTFYQVYCLIEKN